MPAWGQTKAPRGRISREAWAQLSLGLPTLLASRGTPFSPAQGRRVRWEPQLALQPSGATHLLAHVVVGKVDDRTEPLQHVKDQLPVTALSPRGGGKNACLEEGRVLGLPRTPGTGVLGGHYLEESHFADDVIVHVNGKVQTHLVWKLHHQF